MQSILTKNQKRVFLILAVILFFATLSKPYERNIFNVDFGDESDNFATGLWVLEGKKIYKDFFLQHQPMPTIASAGIQKVLHPNTTFILIKRHRELVFLLSFLFILFLTYKFGLAALISGLLIELSKFTLFGNLFLSEALVIYPIIYVALLVYNVYSNNYKLTSVDLLLAAVFLFFIIFSLIPLVIFALLAFALLALKAKRIKRKHFILVNILVLLVYFLVLSNFVSFKDYIYDTIFINLFKFVPFVAGGEGISFVSILFFPFKSLFFANSGFYLILKITAILFVISLTIIARFYNLYLALVVYLILVSVNLRPVPFGLFGAGFHYLPYFSLLVTFTVANLVYIFPKLKYFVAKILLTAAMIILIFAFGNYGFSEFSKKVDPFDMWYVHYSRSFGFSRTIEALAKPGDTLLIMPQESIIYWDTKLLPSSPYFFTLNIMYQPDFAPKVKSAFENNKPDFWYLAPDSGAEGLFGGYFGEYLPLRQGGDNSNITVKKTKLPAITNKQWQEIEKWGNSKPIGLE